MECAGFHFAAGAIVTCAAPPIQAEHPVRISVVGASACPYGRSFSRQSNESLSPDFLQQEYSAGRPW